MQQREAVKPCSSDKRCWPSWHKDGFSKKGNSAPGRESVATASRVDAVRRPCEAAVPARTTQRLCAVVYSAAPYYPATLSEHALRVWPRVRAFDFLVRKVWQVSRRGEGGATRDG